MEGDARVARWPGLVTHGTRGRIIRQLPPGPGPASALVASRKIMGRLPAITGRWNQGVFKHSHTVAFSFIDSLQNVNVPSHTEECNVRVSNIIMRCRRPSTMQVNVVKVNTLSHSICHSQASPQ